MTSTQLSQSQNTKSHWVRNLAVAGIIMIVAIILASGFIIGWFATSPPGSGTTWRQWGMSMQAPHGLTAQYQGLQDPSFPSQATSKYGIVSWGWNGGNTSLSLAWSYVLSGNWSRGYPLIPVSLPCNRIEAGSRGNITMAGNTWSWGTMRCTGTNNVTYYIASASAHYPNGQRDYVIRFIDTNSSVLTNLENYGNTFSG